MGTMYYKAWDVRTGQELSLVIMGGYKSRRFTKKTEVYWNGPEYVVTWWKLERELPSILVSKLYRVLIDCVTHNWVKIMCCIPKLI